MHSKQFETYPISHGAILTQHHFFKILFQIYLIWYKLYSWFYIVLKKNDIFDEIRHVWNANLWALETSDQVKSSQIEIKPLLIF